MSIRKRLARAEMILVADIIRRGPPYDQGEQAMIDRVQHDSEMRRLAKEARKTLQTGSCRRRN